MMNHPPVAVAGEPAPNTLIGARRLRKVAIAAAVVVLSALPASARAPLSDAAVRQAIIQDSVEAYIATGHPCACPYNSARNGSSCGGRSAYSRPGGAAPRSATPPMSPPAWWPGGEPRIP